MVEEKTKRLQEALIRRKGIKGLVTWGEKLMVGTKMECVRLISLAASAHLPSTPKSGRSPRKIKSF
jgi:hypothetical protein